MNSDITLAISEQTDRLLTGGLFLAVVALTVGITFWASRQNAGTADYCGHRRPERARGRRRLHVGRKLPRHLWCDSALWL